MSLRAWRFAVAAVFAMAATMTGASAWLLAANVPAPSARPSILVSRQLLQAEHLAIGDVVSLSGDPSGREPRSFRIGGVYEPTPDPMRLGSARHEVRLHLPDLLDMAAASDLARDPQTRETVDAINVAVADPSSADAISREASTKLPGLLVRSTTGDDQRAAPFIVLERFHLAIAIVTLIASSTFLLALMLMLVDERRQTVGTLRLIGVSRPRIVSLVLLEGFVLALAGAVVGILLSAIFQGGINGFFQWRYDTALIFVRVTPWIALRAVAMAVPLGVISALAASWTLLTRGVLSLANR